jgi:HEAT repeat protein
MESKLLSDEQVREFIANGFVRLQPDVDESVHGDIDRLLRHTTQHESWLGNNVAARIPKLHEVLRSPVVHGALTSLAGPGYYVHPHRAVHRSTPIEDREIEIDRDVDAPQMGKGSNSGSGWHQDAQSPLSRARHHLPRYLIGFYFTHDTPTEMGPTRMQAGSYLQANPVAPRGVVLPEEVTAGTFFLVHFDMIHAGFPNRTDMDRYMVKFVFTRTVEPNAPAWDNRETEWRRPQHCLVPDDMHGAWTYIWNWMRGRPRAPSNDNGIEIQLDALAETDQTKRLRAIYALAGQDAVGRLGDTLAAAAGHGKHNRVLIRDDDGRLQPRDDVRGWPRCWNERAVVMEDAAYALAACGPNAIEPLVGLLQGDDPWVQINAVFALGEHGASAQEAVPHIAPLLDSPLQQVVRQTLDALGAIGVGLGPALPKIEHLLRHHNPEWQEAQVGRGWTGEDQVRLNAAFALLNAVSAREDLDVIEAILKPSLADKNGYVAAVASEALLRIGTPSALASAVQYLSDRRWDDTLMGRAKPF